MSDSTDASNTPKSYWFVGAAFKGTKDQTERFLAEGIWENDWGNKENEQGNRYLEEVRAMQPGDRIAIKSTYVRKKELPFDNKGRAMSVMGIKAIGVIKRNHGDGRFIDVDWKPRSEPIREWYFYTNRRTVWRVSPDDWKPEGLINFTFNGEPQDIDRFRNSPYWKEQFGDTPVDKQRFKWAPFYEEFADKLLAYKNNRKDLIEEIHNLSEEIEGFPTLEEQTTKGSKERLKDICPFTVFALFNRGITEDKRKAIARGLAEFLGVKTSVNSFDAIPLVSTLRSWFFAAQPKRGKNDIDTLWEMFESAIEYADRSETDSTEALFSAYEKAINCRGVKWNLTMGLYWIRPWKYPTLDKNSRDYITKKLDLTIGKSGEKRLPSANEYLSLKDDLETRFEEEDYPVHSFPELSLAAWRFEDTDTSATPSITDADAEDEFADDEGVSEKPPVPIEPYTIDNIIDDGCFLDRATIERILKQLRRKKNLILQGPPGTGKTWLAKKLAYALMGQKDENSLRAVQFHPNLSYEDFVRGWRPSVEGTLTLVDGPFLEMIDKAKKDVGTKYIVVIEEINRGNPAQIFGEMLTLLEAGKRTPSEALELCYRKYPGERVHIPENLYVIGTMNIADRSLALVDFALRRRFAFIDLQPTLGKPWQDWVHEKAGIDIDFLKEIEQRLNSLNNDIVKDPTLGLRFTIGHSYITPNIKIEDPSAWFQGVVESEIGPLLEEYWFDNLEHAHSARDKLVEGI